MVFAELRRLQPVDVRPAVALFQDAFPGRADEVRTWSKVPARRYVAVADKVVAYGAMWPFQADSARLEVVVTPELRRQGLGSLVLNHLTVRAWSDGLRTVQALADEDWEPALSFLRVNRFTESTRAQRQTLDVASVNLDAHREVEARLAAEGVVIVGLTEAATDPLCWQRFAELMHAAQVDPEPPRSAEEFREQHRQAAAAPGAADTFLAVHGDQYVGGAGALGIAVRQEYRGRGIATALTVRVVAAARRRGLRQLRATSGDPALLSFNERLGYRRTSTEVRMVKRLQ